MNLLKDHQCDVFPLYISGSGQVKGWLSVLWRFFPVSLNTGGMK